MAGIIIPVRTRVAITLSIAVVLAVTVAIPRPIPVAISIAIPTTVSLPILVPFTVTLTLAITRRLARMLLRRLFFNPLSPNSDQHQFSLNNIHTMSRDEVMRLRENALIFYQILSTHSLRKCVEISLENLYMYIGA